MTTKGKEKNEDNEVFREDDSSSSSSLILLKKDMGRQKSIPKLLNILIFNIISQLAMLWEDYVISELYNFYRDREHLVSCIVTIGLNTVHVCCLFFSNDWTIVLSIGMTVFSIWNAVQVFTGNTTYQAIRKTITTTSTSTAQKAPSIAALEKLGRRIPDIVVANRRYKVWELSIWNYTLVRRSIFCFYSPLQTICFTLCSCTWLLNDKKILLKGLVAIICYMQGLVLNYLFCKFEMRERMKQLISSELLLEQMQVSDRIWRAGVQSLVQHERSCGSSSGNNHNNNSSKFGSSTALQANLVTMEQDPCNDNDVLNVNNVDEIGTRVLMSHLEYNVLAATTTTIAPSAPQMEDYLLGSDGTIYPIVVVSDS